MGCMSDYGSGWDAWLNMNMSEYGSDIKMQNAAQASPTPPSSTSSLSSSPCGVVQHEKSILLRKDWVTGQNELDPEDELEQGHVEGLPGGVQGVRAFPKPFSAAGMR